MYDKKQKNKLYIGITGSTRYENKTLIKDTIFKLKKAFDKQCIIISLGEKAGADKYIKKFALQFELDYQEYTPGALTSNMYTIHPHTQYKEFKSWDKINRIKKLVNRSDKLIFFQFETDSTIEKLKEIAIKKNKEYKLFVHHEALFIRRD